MLDTSLKYNDTLFLGCCFFFIKHSPSVNVFISFEKLIKLPKVALH